MEPSRVPRRHALGIAIVCLVLGFALLWPMCAEAQERPSNRRFAVVSGALVTLATVDVWQSIPCLRSTTCREVNPLYRDTSPAGVVAIKAAGIGGVTVYAWKLRKHHPKLAWTLLGSLTALQGAVVIHNARVLRSRR